jgi:outer membrane lipoprotein-sorting protein
VSRPERRRFAAALAGALVVPWCVVPGRADAAPARLEDVMARLAQVGASRAEFVETKTMAFLEKPIVSTGTLAYERPGRLERHTRTPHEERMIVAGDDITIEIPAKKQKRTFGLRLNPVLWGFIESIRATLAGDLKTLERFYWVRLSGETARWTLDLEPRDAAMSRYVQAIRLSGGTGGLERVEVFEANGDRADMRIKPA